MAERPTLWNYLRAFGARWFIAMCGPLTVPFAVFAVFVPGTNQKIILSTLAVACAGFSSYWVWRVERLARNAAEDRATEAEGAIRKKEDKTGKAKRLSEFADEAHKLREEICRPGVDISVWQADVQVWTDGVYGFLVEQCAPQASVKFKDVSNMLRSHYGGVPSDCQNHYGVLERRIKSLHAILDNPGVYL